ncbi:hypothetical protein FGG08_004804 [Glutinoglossum americanum]|uniref:Uncharacterized protein n=1 Tax=Glutinoglossum americanum TaxID=1670608 RepID=A0A9P8KZ58_9PEZI|nr:hypothetical protein FGG08_004804 [Glutinoglossum americanum]
MTATAECDDSNKMVSILTTPTNWECGLTVRKEYIEDAISQCRTMPATSLRPASLGAPTLQGLCQLVLREGGAWNGLTLRRWDTELVRVDFQLTSSCFTPNPFSNYGDTETVCRGSQDPAGRRGWSCWVSPTRVTALGPRQQRNPSDLESITLWRCTGGRAIGAFRENPRQLQERNELFDPLHAEAQQYQEELGYSVGSVWITLGQRGHISGTKLTKAAILLFLQVGALGVSQPHRGPVSCLTRQPVNYRELDLTIALPPPPPKGTAVKERHCTVRAGGVACEVRPEDVVQSDTCGGSAAGTYRREDPLDGCSACDVAALDGDEQVVVEEGAVQMDGAEDVSGLPGSSIEKTVSKWERKA